MATFDEQIDNLLKEEQPTVPVPVLAQAPAPEISFDSQIDSLLAEEPEERFEGTLGEAAIAGVKQIPADFPRFFGDLKDFFVTVIENPKETKDALLNLSFGAFDIAEKALVGEGEIPHQTKEEKMAREFARNFKEEFLTEEGFKNTLATKPLDVLSFMSIPVSAGGGLVGSVSASSPKLASLAKALKVTGKVVDPISTVKIISKAPFTLLAKTKPDIARNLMGSVLRLPAKMKMKKKIDIIDTTLDNGFIPVGKSVEAAKSEITKAVKIVNDITLKKTKEGKVFFNVSDLMESKLFDALEEAYKKQTSPAALKAMEKWKTQLLEFRGVEFTPAEALATKRILQAQLKAHFKNMNRMGAPELKVVRKELDDAFQKNLRRALEDLDPDIKKANRRASALSATTEALEDAIGRMSFKDFFSARETLLSAGAIASPQSAHKLFALAILDKIFRTPSLKARLARRLAQAKKIGLKTTGKPSVTNILAQIGKAKERIAKQGEVPRPQPVQPDEQDTDVGKIINFRQGFGQAL
jgi:hypothetical protein